MDGDVCQRDAGCRIGRPAHLPLQCFKYEWTVLPFAQQQTEDDECLSGSKIREQVAHFFMSMSGSKVSAKKSGVWNYHLQFEIIRMLKISHEKNEFLYSAQRVVFFEPFVSLISGGGFVLGEIQRIKHQKALEYWSQILKEQQESGLCIKAFCRSRQMSHHAMYYWIKELREEALLVNPQAPARTTQFAPVSLAQEQQHSCGKMVVHVGSASLEIPEGTAAPDLQRTLQVLKEVFLC